MNLNWDEYSDIAAEAEELGLVDVSFEQFVAIANKVLPHFVREEMSMSQAYEVFCDHY